MTIRFKLDGSHTTATRYRWRHPADWLNWKLTELSQADKSDEILWIARALANQVDSDTIQDAFESDMDADGYFEPVDEAA